MSSYHYTAEVRPHARRSLIIGVVMLVVGACMLPFWWTIVLALLGGVLVLIGGLMLLASIAQLIRGGQWAISVTPKRLSWHSPVFAEPAFDVAMSELSHIERRSKQRSADSARSGRKIRLFAHTTDGRRLSMHPQSGVDIDRVVRALTDAGIELRDTRK